MPVRQSEKGNWIMVAEWASLDGRTVGRPVVITAQQGFGASSSVDTCKLFIWEIWGGIAVFTLCLSETEAKVKAYNSPPCPQIANMCKTDRQQVGRHWASGPSLCWEKWMENETIELLKTDSFSKLHRSFAQDPPRSVREGKIHIQKRFVPEIWETTQRERERE